MQIMSIMFISKSIANTWRGYTECVNISQWFDCQCMDILDDGGSYRRRFSSPVKNNRDIGPKTYRDVSKRIDNGIFDRLRYSRRTYHVKIVELLSRQWRNTRGLDLSYVLGACSNFLQCHILYWKPAQKYYRNADLIRQSVDGVEDIIFNDTDRPRDN
jgi:hypothetical protein